MFRASVQSPAASAIFALYSLMPGEKAAGLGIGAGARACCLGAGGAGFGITVFAETAAGQSCLEAGLGALAGWPAAGLLPWGCVADPVGALSDSSSPSE